MLNKFINGISPSVRLISLILLIICLILANSIYLIIFITILTVILMLIKDEKVNIYVNTLKKSVIFLLIMLVGYIIIFEEYNIFHIILLLYKFIVILFLIKLFALDILFSEMHEGIYGILIPIKRLNINVENFSLDCVMSIYFIKFLITARKNIDISQTLNGKKKFNLKNKIFPMVIFSINELQNLQNKLKIQFYQLNYKKVNIRSRFVLILMVIFFIVCIFKEVML